MNAWVVALGLLVFLAQDKPQKEILHISGGGQFGTAVCILGDVNQDGVSDLAVGSPAASDDCFVGVYSGADGKEIWRVEGQMFQPEFGRSLTALGDLNADGCPDLLAAYPTDWGALDDFNRAWVLSGKDGARLLEILGSQTTRDGFASAVAPAGDLDGDAIPDMWIGAEFGPLEPRLGRVTAFSGKDGHEIRYVDSPKGKLFGRRLIAMGDIDGDGISDLAVGGLDHATGLSLVSGGTAKVLRTVSTGHSGHLASLGRIDDLNGDGAPEVIVSSSGSPLIMLVSGSTGKVLSRWGGDLDGNPSFSKAVVAVPDLDGDGYQEIAVSGSESDGHGAVFLVSSKSGKILSSLKGTPGFGKGLACGDLDGDGSAELVVGEAGGKDRETGTVHVFTLHSD